MKWQAGSGSLVTFRDGTYRVGIDIPAGTYRTEVPKELPYCHWERRRSPDPASVIAHGTADGGTEATVVIKPTDKVFVVGGCGTWMRIF